MKRFVLAVVAVLAVALLAVGAWAEKPTITLKATYTSGGKAVNLTAIEPYKTVKFLYTISADTPSISYSTIINTGSQKGTKTGKITGTTKKILHDETFEFSSEESGSVRFSVTDANGGVTNLDTKVKAIKGTRPAVAVKGIELSAYPYKSKGKSIKVALNTYSGVTVKSIISPDDATNKKVKWTTSNTKVAYLASVSGESNEIEAGIPGKATITATTDDGSYKATCEVTVTGFGASKITLSPATVALAVGEQKNITASDGNDGSYFADYQTITWSIKDASIAKLLKPSETGIPYICGLQGLKAGTTTITASTISNKGENISATATVTVAKADGGNTDDSNNNTDGDKDTADDMEGNDGAEDDDIVDTEPSPTPTPGKKSSGGGGCDAGLLGLFAMVLLPVINKGRK